jgi:antitoxin component YwqK of YwqJK toxin-antitoxin module
MAERFDPYHKWLGIPPEDQPANLYRLLGLKEFEADADVIATAADRQMQHVRNYQSGEYGALSQELLNELSAARVCLLSTQKKAEYDATLWAEMAAETAVVAAPLAQPVERPTEMKVAPPVRGPASTAPVALPVATPVQLVVQRKAPPVRRGAARAQPRRRHLAVWIAALAVLAALGVGLGVAAAVWWPEGDPPAKQVAHSFADDVAPAVPVGPTKPAEPAEAAAAADPAAKPNTSSPDTTFVAPPEIVSVTPSPPHEPVVQPSDVSASRPPIVVPVEPTPAPSSNPAPLFDPSSSRPVKPSRTKTPRSSYSAAPPVTVALPGGKSFSTNLLGIDLHASQQSADRDLIRQSDNAENVVVCHYPNDSVMAMAHHKQGVLDGRTLAFHPNNEILFRASYDDGKRLGGLQVFDESGCCVFWCQYSKGRRQGYGAFWQEGKLRLVLEYQFDRLATVHVVEGETVSQTLAAAAAADNDSIKSLLDEVKKVEDSLGSTERDIRKEVREEEEANRQARVAALNPGKRQAISGRINQHRAERDSQVKGLRQRYGL